MALERNLHGIYMVYIRSLYGVYTVYIWCLCDVYSVLAGVYSVNLNTSRIIDRAVFQEFTGTRLGFFEDIASGTLLNAASIPHLYTSS